MMRKWKRKLFFLLAAVWIMSGMMCRAAEDLASAEKKILSYAEEKAELRTEDILSAYAGEVDRSRAGERDESSVGKLNASYDGEGNIYNAVFLLTVNSNETGEIETLFSCFAVEQDGLTWFITDPSLAQLDYENYNLVLILDQETLARVVAVPAGDAAVLYAMNPVSVEALRIAGAVPDGNPLAVMYCLGEFQEDGKNCQDLATAAAYQEDDGSYVVTEGNLPGLGTVWGGVPLMETEHMEVCGVGVYDGEQFRFHSLTNLALEKWTSVENWGKDDQEESGTKQQGVSGGTNEKEESPGGQSEEQQKGSREEASKEGSGGNSGGSSAESVLKENQLKKKDYYILGVLVLIAAAAGIFWNVRRRSAGNGGSGGNPAGYNGGSGGNPAGYNGGSGGSPAGYNGGSGGSPAGTSYTIRCIAGPKAGESLALQDSVYIGRDSSRCGFVFPDGTKGVSRCHCMVKVQGKTVILKDLDSTYGTFLKNGVRLQSGVEYHVEAGTEFYLANTNVIMRIEKGGY